MVAVHSGLLEVYDDALSATALVTSQLPRAATLPTILTVWPKVVVFSSLKVTATAVAVVQEAVVVVAVGLVNVAVVAEPVVPGVWLAGKDETVAVEYVPTWDVAAQTAGTEVALEAVPAQPAGTTPARLAAAVRNEAYDQVRSRAERGVPLLRSYCSARDPLDAAYCETMFTKPSA